MACSWHAGLTTPWRWSSASLADPYPTAHVGQCVGRAAGRPLAIQARTACCSVHVAMRRIMHTTTTAVENATALEAPRREGSDWDMQRWRCSPHAAFLQPARSAGHKCVARRRALPVQLAWHHVYVHTLYKHQTGCVHANTSGREAGRQAGCGRLPLLHSALSVCSCWRVAQAPMNTSIVFRALIAQRAAKAPARRAAPLPPWRLR